MPGTQNGRTKLEKRRDGSDEDGTWMGGGSKGPRGGFKDGDGGPTTNELEEQVERRVQEQERKITTGSGSGSE